MKTLQQKIQAFAAISITTVIIAFGVLPASAAALSATATAPGVIESSGTNSFPITVTTTAVTGSPANMFNINLPQGWTFVTPAANCNDIVITGISATINCQKINFGSNGGFATIQVPTNTPFSAGQQMSATFAANTINVGSSRVFTINLATSQTGGTSVDNGQATLAGGAPSPTPTPTPEAPVEQKLANTGGSILSAVLPIIASFFVITGIATLTLTRRKA